MTPCLEYVKFKQLNRQQERGLGRRLTFGYWKHVFNTEYQEVESDYQIGRTGCKGKVSEE